MTRQPARPVTGDDAAANGSGKVTRDVVLAAALEIIDRDGADALSMRRRARALDRDPMILYRHAPNKAALLDGVAEIVLAQLKVDSADPDRAAQLRAVARDYRALALAHPNVVPLLVARPLATPLGLRPPGTPVIRGCDRLFQRKCSSPEHRPGTVRPAGPDTQDRQACSTVTIGQSLSQQEN